MNDTAAQEKNTVQSAPIQTRWAREIAPDNALPEYPRPQLMRNNWTNLNGLWEYAVTDSITNSPTYEGQILVPYPLESVLSGVKRTLLPEQRLWYRRSFDRPALSKGERLLLHFGAVDYQCWVYVNGKEVGTHEGGYMAFSFDITDFVRSGANELVVKVYDPSDAGIGPRGKQVLNPQNIYYTPSSGIWQTVWLETVPKDYITRLKITPNVDNGAVRVVVESATDKPVTVTAAGRTVKGHANTEISLPISDVRLWSPADPYLYDLEVTLGADKVKSYFGMRKVSVERGADGHDRIFLNGEPYFNLGTLDQGFWPDGLYTAPTDEALAFDIKAIKAMGFNTIRKHIKVEPARWYYHADRLGILVWQDFVQPNPNLPEGAKEIFEKQGAEMMAQLHNHPSITTWVLFNEKWGQYDQELLTQWVKDTDPSRLVNGHSGEYLYVNEKLRSPSPDAYVNSDITDVHSYPDPMNSLQMDGKARVLGEFGGIGVFIPGHQWNTGSAWGYINEKPAALKAKYSIMNKHLQLLQKEGLSASIYTQPFDVEGEQNGLMTYDREVIKIPFAELREIHRPLSPDRSTIPEVTAIDADLTDPAVTYEQALQEYIDGRETDLKRLAMLAAQTGDAAGKNRFNSLYILSLSAPYSEADLAFIEGSTTKVTDAGFPILVVQSEGNRPLHIKLMNIIFTDVIQPYVPTPDTKPNWEEIREKVKSYGAPGEEMYLRAKTIHTLNQQDWDAFRPVAKEYLEKYGEFIKPEEKQLFEEKL
ncbi:hypothetical protein GCM10011386_26830 [Parapedobacter defluvii]|uniref:Glycoside hydrolase family 2 n=1 Tax=Parapedobacter defluvii TaxID=2045106 RepID=A0ABQ1M466_9SPHI|nr:sugar-binding domain-containing protein [Parapedobacter defluvii]GGC33356.1 hypothetical protein GCM10011386_26830 [Parapedobacter defluvii]